MTQLPSMSSKRKSPSFFFSICRTGLNTEKDMETLGIMTLRCERPLEARARSDKRAEHSRVLLREKNIYTSTGKWTAERLDCRGPRPGGAHVPHPTLPHPTSPLHHRQLTRWGMRVLGLNYKAEGKTGRRNEHRFHNNKGQSREKLTCPLSPQVRVISSP